ncbi:hypothetical protein [Corynebacterium sp. A21]|uniref:hypothetical protein n=1 Tax=Corynebacterium sp. A21 TaxID=3457318 RepID=UPI003FD68A1E
MFPSTDLEFEKTAVRMLGEEHAVVHALWRMSGQLAPGSTGERGGDRRGVFTFVVSLIAARWLAIAAHNTDIVPGAQTHLASASGSVSAVHYEAQADS